MIIKLHPISPPIQCFISMGGLNTYYYFIREKILFLEITTSLVNSNDQLDDVFTKFLTGPQTNYLYDKLGIYDLVLDV